MVILASFQQHPLLAFAAATTLITGAAYTLWLAKRVIWGEVGNAHVAELKDMNPREWIVLGVFAAGVLLVGVWPKPLTDLLEPSIAQLASQLAATKL
jgi:NADH-quinone oxidoreductase subunit M